MFTKNGLYKKIDEAMNATRNKTQKKETIGKQLLHDSGLLDVWFKNHKDCTWVEDKDIQLSGTDYLLTSQHNRQVAIDLKVGVGRDYHRLAIENEQYTERDGCWKRTFTSDKRTDFLVFVNVSTEDEMVDFVIVNYRWIVKEVERVNRGEKTIFDQTIPKESFNGTGTYWTIDLEKCKQSRQMFVHQASFDELTKPGRKSHNALESILDTL